MRKFIVDEIELKLNSITTAETYLQKITSEITLNGKTSKNSSEKTLNVQVRQEENQLLQARIKTTNHRIKLDNLLKKQEEITLRMATLTDTVLLGIDTSGAINTIYNHQIIQQKWSILKQELAQLYEGNTAEIYLLGIDRKIKDPKKLMADFQQNRLFGLLWNGLHSFYSDDISEKKKRIKTISNMVEHIPIVINETVFCEQINRDTNEISLRLNGQLNNKETFTKKIEHHFVRNGGNKKSKLELTVYDGVYKFNTNTGLIKEASLVIETTFGDNYKRKDQFNIHTI